MSTALRGHAECQSAHPLMFTRGEADGIRRYRTLHRLQIHRLRHGLSMRLFPRGEQMLYINPNECIDCGACISECPVEAIYSEDSVPQKWREYIVLNAEGARRHPIITEKKQS